MVLIMTMEPDLGVKAFCIDLFQALACLLECASRRLLTKMLNTSCDESSGG